MPVEMDLARPCSLPQYETSDAQNTVVIKNPRYYKLYGTLHHKVAVSSDMKLFLQ